jgi:cell division protein FtsB
MEHPTTATTGHTSHAAVLVRGDRLARTFLALSLALCAWMAVAPTRHYLETRSRAAAISAEKSKLVREQRQLSAQSAELSRGSGLEEQARRQGLIAESERSYVVEGLAKP